MNGVSSILLWVGEGLLRHEDTVEELSLVLVSDSAGLVGPGACKRKRGIIFSVEHELILHIRLEHSGTLWKLNEVNLLTSEEVLDLERVLVLGDSNVDGEVIVHKSHLVSVALQLSNKIIKVRPCSQIESVDWVSQFII